MFLGVGLDRTYQHLWFQVTYPTDHFDGGGVAPCLSAMRITCRLNDQLMKDTKDLDLDELGSAFVFSDMIACCRLHVLESFWSAHINLETETASDIVNSLPVLARLRTMCALRIVLDVLLFLPYLVLP